MRQTFGREVRLKEISELTLGEFEEAVLSSTRRSVDPLIAGKRVSAVCHVLCVEVSKEKPPSGLGLLVDSISATMSARSASKRCGECSGTVLPTMICIIDPTDSVSNLRYNTLHDIVQRTLLRLATIHCPTKVLRSFDCYFTLFTQDKICCNRLLCCCPRPCALLNAPSIKPGAAPRGSGPER